MTVTIYSKPNCPHCNIVKAQFKKHNVPFTEVDITKNPDALERIKAQGFAQAPIVFGENDSFSGADAHGIARFVEKYGA